MKQEHLKLPELRVNSLLFNVVNESSLGLAYVISKASNGKWAQIFRFRVNLRIYPPPSQAKAGNGIQLYILWSFIYLLSLWIVCIWSWASGQVSHALLFYHVVVVVIVYYTTAYRCCCCVLHISNNNNYKIHRNWLWSLC